MIKRFRKSMHVVKQLRNFLPNGKQIGDCNLFENEQKLRNFEKAASNQVRNCIMDEAFKSIPNHWCWAQNFAIGYLIFGPFHVDRCCDGLTPVCSQDSRRSKGEFKDSATTGESDGGFHRVCIMCVSLQVCLDYIW